MQLSAGITSEPQYRMVNIFETVVYVVLIVENSGQGKVMQHIGGSGEYSQHWWIQWNRHRYS